MFNQLKPPQSRVSVATRAEERLVAPRFHALLEKMPGATTFSAPIGPMGLGWPRIYCQALKGMTWHANSRA